MSHCERTELDFYLILYTKITSRRKKELTVTNKTTREPVENTVKKNKNLSVKP